jgi:hypothetical protein
MRRRVTAAIVSLGLFAAAAAPGIAPAQSPVASIAKTCRSGYTHAVIGGSQKCHHRGEFCSSRYRSQYPRYGFHCYGGRLH